MCSWVAFTLFGRHSAVETLAFCVVSCWIFMICTCIFWAILSLVILSDCRVFRLVSNFAHFLLCCILRILVDSFVLFALSYCNLLFCLIIDHLYLVDCFLLH